MRVGLDVGGTKTDAVAVDADGQVVARVRRATGWGADAVLDTIRAAVDDIVLAAPGMQVDSIGIGIPGLVEPGSTSVMHAVNLGIEELDVAAELEPRLGLPVHLENDVKAAAVGAYHLDMASGSLAYLNLGTGVAAGIVSDGVLWRGARGTAGEVGHLSVDPAGPLCRCGQHGCIEALAGGASLGQRWGRPGSLPVRDVFDAADAGEAGARLLRRDLAYGVAAAVRVLVLTADVDVVVLGGGLTALGARLSDDVRAALAASASSSAFLRSLRLDERVRMLPAGSPAAAVGAALIGAARDPEEALSHG